MNDTVRCIGLLDRTGAVQQAALGLPEEYDLVEFVHPDDLDQLDEPVDVLVVGRRELSGAGLRRLLRWTTVHPASAVIAHVDGAPVTTTQLRAAGVHGRIRGAATTRSLAAAVRRAERELAVLSVAAGRLRAAPGCGAPGGGDAPAVDPGGHAAAAPTAAGSALLGGLEGQPSPAGDEEDLARPAAAPSPTGARLVTVASATGGCGKTFFATNMATLLARAGQRVLLVDLDLQFGEVAAALQVKHPYSLYDGLYNAKGQRLPAEEFTASLGELTAHHPLGFDVLTAPRDPLLADVITARDAQTVLDVVTPHYDVILADTPPSLNDVVIAALDRSSAVVVMASLDVPSLRNLTAFLDVLSRLRLDDERLRLLLNKVDKDVGVTVAQAQEAFDNRFDAAIPVDRAVSRSINLGTTVVAHEPRTKVARSLVAAVGSLASRLELDPAAERVLDPQTPAPQPTPVRRSAVLGAWRRLRQGGHA